MEKGNKHKGWFSLLLAGQVLLMINIGLNIFIKADNILSGLKEIGEIFLIPGIILWILPVIALRTYGDISSGGSFLATTQLVDRGIYRIIRHPQYLGFMLFSLGMALFYQLDITIGLSLLTVLFLIIGIKEEDKELIDQFGEEYETYKQKVPSINMFTGIFRLIVHSGNNEKKS